MPSRIDIDQLVRYASSHMQRADPLDIGTGVQVQARSKPGSKAWTYFRHHCEVAVFLAEQELPTGSPEDQWKRALSILRRDLLGSGTRYQNLTLMGAGRKDMTVGQRWDCWGHATVGDGGVEYDIEGSVDQTIILGDFMEDLRSVLTEKEFQLLEKVYVQGVSRGALVDDLVKQEDRYDSEEGRKQALNRINVAIHRARKKAMVVLPERWKSFAGSN